MKKYINQGIVFLLLGFSLVFTDSCKVKNAEPDGAYVGYDYYPLEVGRYIIYDVYDTVYNEATRVDSIYELKEVIHSVIVEGDEVKYVLYQFFKERSASDWPSQPDSVWTLTNISNQLIRTENNTQYVKLVFPVKEGITWDGNARNIYDEQIYSMKNVDRSYFMSNYIFNPTLTMVIADDESRINRDFRYEIYARGIGPIKKDYKVYAYDQTQVGTGKVDFGHHKVFIMKGYGAK
jgi:hypothetical protein